MQKFEDARKFLKSPQDQSSLFIKGIKEKKNFILV